MSSSLLDRRVNYGAHPPPEVDVGDAMGGNGLSDEHIVDLIKAIAPDHVLFGSDYPVYDPAIVIEKIKSYPFTDKEKRLILGENCAGLFRVNI